MEELKNEIGTETTENGLPDMENLDFFRNLEPEEEKSSKAGIVLAVGLIATIAGGGYAWYKRRKNKKAKEDALKKETEEEAIKDLEPEEYTEVEPSKDSK